MEWQSFGMAKIFLKKSGKYVEEHISGAVADRWFLGRYAIG
jgi:hypothetical protein